MNARTRFLIPATFAIVAALLSPAPAIARKGVAGTPRTVVYTHAINQRSPAERDSLAFHDVLCASDRPEMYRDLRARRMKLGGRGDLRFVYAWQPQYVPAWDGNTSIWWYAGRDSVWSLIRKVQIYAYRNNWYLKDNAGRVLNDGSPDWTYLNWTQYCPRGTYGSSKGLRASQWLAKVALPEFLTHRFGEPAIFEPWDWDGFQGAAQNALQLEVLSDCLGSIAHGTLCNADPNRDGRIEGVCKSCSGGGAQEPLSNLMRMENAVFWQEVRRWLVQYPTLVITVNDGTNASDPAWRFNLSGQKLENFLTAARVWTWRDWFYGRDGVGYWYQERAFGRPGLPDRLQGWDVGWITAYHDVLPAPGDTVFGGARRERLAIGTALLGNGGVQIAWPARPGRGYWPALLDTDFGDPLGAFTREGYGPDTLFARAYRYGFVEVNPGARAFGGVAPGDARFGYWCDPEGLEVVRAWWRFLWLFWRERGNLPGAATEYHLRYALEPITAATWDDALDLGSPATARASAATVEVATERALVGRNFRVILPKDIGRPYHVALRARVFGRWSPAILTAQVE